MKKILVILLMGASVGLTSCTNTEPTSGECIYCSGCFSSWTECRDNFHPMEGMPTTWEEYREYMLANNGNTTTWCSRTP